ncbi:Leucine-rich repeats and immunoglobulin-like domains protein 3 [Zootermopsis nevadensis]|uniref:Leucine-rich repeats and immunoglobulin-like domains protein 3 n=2 Tax=Zootermopsis nevadensis TaxID=136037 RepID=A0A067RGH1_ZOONE|nr:Leucine-rich repeats and immunoglobulin-like domains protein 3 [Zootermopsis nevadensis]
MRTSTWLLGVILLVAHSSTAQCPWHRDIKELQSSCICAYNLGQELSVQCDMVDFSLLLSALDTYARTTPLDLLYVNNSTVIRLENGAFKNLRLNNVQLSGCKIRTIVPGAFSSQEATLRNLNLQDNELEEVPVESLRLLSNLSLLDLSRNHIGRIPDEAFVTLHGLSTLKLSDNNLTLSPGAFRGLEDSLKNLNLKGTRQKRIPEAVRGLRTLAFLDLAQNGLRELPGPGIRLLEDLHSLTALNMERNLIQGVNADAFSGVNDTLSSLSLLNNLMTDFPTAAINSLTELRVLDIGFNLLTELPGDAFFGTPSLTLLALDGNPLTTVPELALAHLNTTLRGLSLGGRFLHCDCRLRWVTEWIRRSDLQVTSRERNPQFCGSPTRLKDRGFYTIQPDELTCGIANDLENIAAIQNEAGNKKPPKRDEEVSEEEENHSVFVPPTSRLKPTTPKSTTTISTTVTTTTTPPSSTTTIQTTTTHVPRPVTIPSTIKTTPKPPLTTTRGTTSTTTTSRPTTTTRRGNVVVSRTTVPPWRGNNSQQRPPVVLGFPSHSGKHEEVQEVMVRNAYRQDNSVIIQWDSETANILGFRVVYRLFGDKSFKQGPPLEASEREFKIKNVPAQECIVVCVISLEDVVVTPETVPYNQCREVRTVTSPSSNMDKITIAASAAICGTVVIAVIVFVAASRRRSRKLHTLQQHETKGGIPVGGLPVTCCTGMGPTPSPGGPLSSLATLSAFTTHKDWDQVSMYSNRSIPRPRVYHMDRQGSVNMGCTADDMHSHASHLSSKGVKTRSIADGQSQHSFSNHSGRYLSGNSYAAGLVNSRPELRQSRQSLAATSDHLSRMSYPASHQHHQPSVTSSRRQRPRSRTRDHQSGLQRPGSRYSTAGSTHTLNNYCDTSDNWTDHDMDIYMARNPTTRGGLVPL